MPLYEFYNEEIDERYELMMTYDNKVKYLKKNPHIKEIIGAPNIVGGTGDRVKTDDGFKEVLSKIGDAQQVQMFMQNMAVRTSREKISSDNQETCRIQSRKNDTTKN